MSSFSGSRLSLLNLIRLTHVLVIRRKKTKFCNNDSTLVVQTCCDLISKAQFYNIFLSGLYFLQFAILT